MMRNAGTHTTTAHDYHCSCARHVFSHLVFVLNRSIGDRRIQDTANRSYKHLKAGKRTEQLCGDTRARVLDSV